jgi:hypothetical protein
VTIIPCARVRTNDVTEFKVWALGMEKRGDLKEWVAGVDECGEAEEVVWIEVVVRPTIPHDTAEKEKKKHSMRSGAHLT